MATQVCVAIQMPSAPQGAKGMARARKEILYIETDGTTAGLLADELSNRGFAVRIAHDGQEGLLAILKKQAGPGLVRYRCADPLRLGHLAAPERDRADLRTHPVRAVDRIRRSGQRAQGAPAR